MAEMKRNQDQQGSNRQSNMGTGSNQDMQSGRGQQESKKQEWDGHERRTGAERRGEYGMDMNEGSSR
jgi:hypothetical protein